MKKEMGIDPITGGDDLGYLIVSGLKGLFPQGCFHKQIRIKGQITAILDGYTLPPGAELLQVVAVGTVVKTYPDGKEATHVHRRYESVISGLPIKIVTARRKSHIRPL